MIPTCSIGRDAESGRRAAAAQFASALVSARGQVTNSGLDQVRSAGFSDREILEIVALSAQFLLTNMLASVAQLDIDVPDGDTAGWHNAKLPSRRSSCRLSQQLSLRRQIVRVGSELRRLEATSGTSATKARARLPDTLLRPARRLTRASRRARLCQHESRGF